MSGLHKELVKKGFNVIETTSLGSGRHAVLATKGGQEVSFLYDGSIKFQRTGTGYNGARYYYGLQTKSYRDIPKEKMFEK